MDQESDSLESGGAPAWFAESPKLTLQLPGYLKGPFLQLIRVVYRIDRPIL